LRGSFVGVLTHLLADAALLKPEPAGSCRVRVEGEAVQQWRVRAAAAIGAVAQTTGNTNADRGTFEVETVRVDNGGSVGDGAPYSYGVGGWRIAPMRGPADHRARDGQKRCTIWQA
jgi:hypothetical protein